MYKGKKILAIVPARGGSKGIKLKNLTKVNNKSLIQITSEILKKIKYIDKIILSSDHKEIIKEGIKNGLDIPFLRPKKISGDLIGDTPVILHALEHFEKKNQKFDIILLIQVTSPLRKIQHITKCITKLINSKLDSVFTVSKIDEKYHPLKQFLIKGAKINYFDKQGKGIIRRQELGKTYIRNGICYAFTTKCIKKQKDKIGKKSSYVVVNEDFINIDTSSDLEKLKKYKL
tara:strand:- start:761 stop:1453 length:693 start_codon:yes stop_codon:yes gene_type:complete